MPRLQDKSILITGASPGGIGAAIADRCAAEGARVMVHDLSFDGATQSSPHPSVEADLCEDGAPARLIEAAVAELGKLDCLVNNAACVEMAGISDTDTSTFDRAIAVNVRAPFFLIQAALPHLAETKGCVLNIGSVNAYCGQPDLVPYSVSKGALMTMTRNLGDALHAEHGVRVNQVNPGWVLTENEHRRKVAQGLPEDWAETVAPTFLPSGRLITPEEIAAAAVYWLGDEAGPVSGCVTELAQVPFIGRNPVKE